MDNTKTSSLSIIHAVTHYQVQFLRDFRSQRAKKVVSDIPGLI